MNPEYSIKVGSRRHPILFNVYGMTKMERVTGMSFADLAAAISFGIDPDSFKNADAKKQQQMTLSALRQLGLRELQALLFAGLEGGRRKFKPDQPDFDFEEVGEMILEAGGYKEIAPVVIPAYAAFVPKLMGIEAPEQEEEDQPKNAKARRTAGKRSTKKRS